MELQVEKMIQMILKLVARLDNIAAKNKDTFVYRIEIHRINIIQYRFVCEESAEGRWLQPGEFTSGVGHTIEAAVKAAEDGIPEALKQWGYKNAK